MSSGEERPAPMQQQQKQQQLNDPPSLPSKIMGVTDLDGSMNGIINNQNNQNVSSSNSSAASPDVKDEKMNGQGRDKPINQEGKYSP